MSARDLVMAAAGSAGDSNLYSDDVFSAYTYTGNGSTQTINNGIDLAGKGGMVWIKGRSQSSSHSLRDSVRGVNQDLDTRYTSGQSAMGGITAFNSNGFTIGSYSDSQNYSGMSTASWTFRKAPKFFDVVTYTGNGSTSSRLISHSLGIKPGFLIIKRTDTTSDWIVFARNTSGNFALFGASAGTGLQSSASAGFPDSAAVSGFLTSSTFDCVCPGGYLAVAPNVNGATYVAYLFAHDPSADGIIQCGSFTTDASGNATVNLGWEPQWMLFRARNIPNNWQIIDTMRGWTGGAVSETDSKASPLYANLSDAESVIGGYAPIVNQTGFEHKNSYSPNGTFIYLAIRRPNKPPKTGTQVYNAIAKTTTQGAQESIGFVFDLATIAARTGTSSNFTFEDRLRGLSKSDADNATRRLITSSTAAEAAGNPSWFFSQSNNAGVGAYFASSSIVGHFFRRAPGFFDVVCYKGTGVARTVPHGLGVAPELMITKRRNLTQNWYTVGTPFTSGHLMLDLPNAKSDYDIIGANPTSSVFTITHTTVNANGSTYVAYLFASLPGISKVGSYTGNGSSQTINCGFSTGARFILIKRIDSDGGWYVWDTARGIVSANDPHLSLNTTAAEVTSNDSVDPDSTGFIVNQVTATDINVSAATYLYLAIA